MKKPITVKFKNRVCYVFFGEYSNGRTAIQLDLKSNGDPFIVATHNIPEAHLEENEVIIKDYGENEGILDVLVNAGIVKYYNKLLMYNGQWPIATLLINPHSNQNDMITKNNYFSQVREQNILSRFPDAADYHEFVVSATDNGADWTPYEEEKETREVIDAYFKKLNDKLNSGSTQSKSAPVAHRKEHEGRGKSKRKHGSKKRARKPAPEKPAKKRKQNRKPERKKKTHKPKKQRKVLNLPKGKLVELVDPHLLFVGRFLRMNNQKRTRNALEKFFSQINHAADARILRKASAYAHHILYIQKQLLKYLEAEAEEVTVRIPSAKFDELLRAVAKEQQMASVRLLKRYHNMAGRPTTIEKAMKLYNEFYNAVEKGKIPENDRLFKRVVKVMRDLSDYVKAEDSKAELVRLPAELGGVLGFMDGCLCQKDREVGSHEAPDDVSFSLRK